MKQTKEPSSHLILSSWKYHILFQFPLQFLLQDYFLPERIKRGVGGGHTHTPKIKLNYLKKYVHALYKTVASL